MPEFDDRRGPSRLTHKREKESFQASDGTTQGDTRLIGTREKTSLLVERRVRPGQGLPRHEHLEEAVVQSRVECYHITFDVHIVQFVVV